MSIIKKFKNKITLDKYINLALYNEQDGYYEKKGIFGKSGDFITSPYISSIFGEIIAVWILDQFINKKIYNFSILEIGAGEGYLAKDILNTFEKFKNIKFKFNYVICEKSNFYKKQQKNKLYRFNIKWINNIKNFKKKNCIVLSNELIDAFPIKQLFKNNNAWYEKYVKLNSKLNKFEFVDVKIKKSHQVFKKIYPLKKLNFIEYEPDIENFVKNISNILKFDSNNIFITFDYGYNSIDFKNTIQALYKHKNANILTNIGNVDITHLVNFYYIKKLFQLNKINNINYHTQSEFLINSGINIRLNQVIKYTKNKENQKKLYLSVERLISKNKMGELFKVLIASKN